MKNRYIVAGLAIFFIVLGAAFSFWYYQVSKSVKQPELVYWGDAKGKNIRPFTFANQEGDSISLKDVQGKILVVEYFFTTCKSICPIMNDNMVRVYNAYKTDDDVLILSHTVDPKRDSVAAMKEYSMKFDADPKRWMFLTGNKQDLYNQARYSYLLTAQEAGDSVDIEDDFIHEKYFVLVDKQGRLRAHKGPKGTPELYDGTDSLSVQNLINDIAILEKEG